MKRNTLYLVILLVGLLAIAFMVGLVLVKPSERSLVESLPVVGKWIADRRAAERPVIDEAVLTKPFEAGGIKKGVEEGEGGLVYLVKGKLVEDAALREDGMIQGKMVVDGHLQSQPLGGNLPF